ncbi:MAG: ABC transporter permease [Paracoccaceae bacterium]|nr:ABC transporter permease [Paracoccaceae bacterium]
MNAPSPQDLEQSLQLSPRVLLMRRIRAHGGLVFGAAVLALIMLVALAAPLLAPHDPFLQDLPGRLQPPVWAEQGDWDHVLGTDQLGRDYLSRLIYGARLSLTIGFLAMLISGLIGTTLGLCAGYLGGRTDMAITFIITARLSMPIVLIALAVAALLGGSLEIVILILGFLLWDRFAVVARSATMRIRDADFVLAARTVGCSTWRILIAEILPNVADALIVVATLEMAHAILLEAALSFLGLGVQPPLPSWGLMIAEGRDYLFFEPWLIMIVGAALFVLVLAINLLGDGIRDVTSPDAR